jgi:hypothetical protein
MLTQVTIFAFYRGDCDELIFNFSELSLTLRSIRNGIQYDVSVGLETLYVTDCQLDRNMVTIRSSLIPGLLTPLSLCHAFLCNFLYLTIKGGYLSTIQQYDWMNIAEQIRKCIQATNDGVLQDIYSLRAAPNLEKCEENIINTSHSQSPKHCAPHTETQHTFITADVCESFVEPHQQNNDEEGENRINIIKVNPAFTPLSPRKIKASSVLLKLRISKGSNDAIRLDDASATLCESEGSFKRIETSEILVPGRTAFNHSETLQLINPAELALAETAPVGMFQTLNVRPLYPSSDINHPKSWDRASLYHSFRRHHGPNISKSSHSIHLPVSTTFNVKAHSLLDEKEKRAQEQRVIFPPPRAEPYKYVLDDDCESQDPYITDLEPEITDQRAIRELQKLMKNHMRAGEPFFPMKVVGVQPPTVQNSCRSPNVRRRALTKKEYLDMHFSPRLPCSEIKSNEDLNKEYLDVHFNTPSPLTNMKSVDDSIDSGKCDSGNSDLEGPVPPSAPKQATKHVRRRFREKEASTSKPQKIVNKEANEKRVVKTSREEVKIDVPPLDSIKPEDILPSPSMEDVLEPNLGKVVMIVESRRLMQLYFAKKFLQLDILADIYNCRSNAARALFFNPSTFSHVFVSYNDLVSDGNLRNSLLQIIDPRRAGPSKGEHNNTDLDWRHWNPSMFRTSVSLIVYGDVAEGSISDTDTESSDLLEDLSTDEEETKNIADTVLNERCDQRREAKLLRREDKISVCGIQNFITQFYTNTFV